MQDIEDVLHVLQLELQKAQLLIPSIVVISYIPAGQVSKQVLLYMIFVQEVQ